MLNADAGSIGLNVDGHGKHHKLKGRDQPMETGRGGGGSATLYYLSVMMIVNIDFQLDSVQHS